MNLPLSIPFSTSEPGAEVQDTVLSQPFGWVDRSAQGWSRPQMGTTRARIAQQLPSLPSRKVFATRTQQLCVLQVMQHHGKVLESSLREDAVIEVTRAKVLDV